MLAVVRACSNVDMVALLMVLVMGKAMMLSMHSIENHIATKS